MRSFFILLSSLVTFWTLTVSAAAPGLDVEKFEALVNKTLTEGTVLESVYGTTVYLARIVPNDTGKPRSADYFTAEVVVANGQVIPRRFDVVSENWTINADGNWEIEQYIFLITTSANLEKVTHQRVIETPDMHLIRVEQIPVPSLEDPAVVAALKIRMDAWFQWMETK